MFVIAQLMMFYATTVQKSNELTTAQLKQTFE
jgi:hypothetical protein